LIKLIISLEPQREANKLLVFISPCSFPRLPSVAADAQGILTDGIHGAVALLADP
jgi:hypothetical protein